MVKISGVNKFYNMGENSIHVLRDISLNVGRGEFVAVLGASGSGKSTLMNIIGCMDTADSGEYLLDGVSIGECADRELANIRNNKIGFIFQKYHLIPQFSVLQNILLPLLIRGISRKEAIAVAREKIRLVGLEDRISHRPKELSGGQQQRVAIARALVTEPSLLLADEPTGALDSVTGNEILALFKELNDLGNTIIMITHDKNVAQFGKRTVHIRDGVVEE